MTTPVAMGLPVVVAVTEGPTPNAADIEEMHRLTGTNDEELQAPTINLFSAALREETITTLMWHFRSKTAPRLRHLCLATSKGLTDATVADIARSLPGAAPSLQILDLNGPQGSVRGYIGDAGGQALADMLPRLPHLQSLLVARNSLGDAAAGVLAKSVGACPTLRMLELFHNSFSVGVARELVGAMAGRAGLAFVELEVLVAGERLDVMRSDLSDADLELLVATLPRAPEPLRFLDVSENGHADARGLCAALGAGSLPALTSLNMGANKLDGETLAALGGALGGVPLLQTLGLSRTTLGDSGLAALTAGFAKGGAELKFLDLRKCAIGDEGATALATSLGGGALPKLRELNLRENAIGADETLGALAAALTTQAGNSSSIVAIELQGNPFKHKSGTMGLSTPAGLKALQKACKESKIRLGIS